MARPLEQSILDEATTWHLRISEGAEADWDGFVAWLEADPRNDAAYDAVVDAELAFDELCRQVKGNGLANAPARRAQMRPFRPLHRMRWQLSALAASVVLALLGAWSVTSGLNRGQEIITAPGEVRTLALGDGTRVVVNGGTRIVLDGNNPRKAELKAGEAQFSVRHDPAHPFSLVLGTQQILDVGTVFNVFRNDRTTRVEVAEGSVRFEDGETRLRLDRGDTLVSNGDRIVEGSRPVEAIGSWTRGMLVYRGTPLVDVVADLSRNRGIAIELGPELSDRTFTGVIQLGGNDDDLRARVTELLGVKIAKTPEGWAVTR